MKCIQTGIIVLITAIFLCLYTLQPFHPALSIPEDETADNNVVTDAIDYTRVVYDNKPLLDPQDRNTIEDGHIAASYTFLKTMTYKDHFICQYEVYLPCFTDEISFPGKDAIMEYYKRRSVNAADRMDPYIEECLKTAAVYWDFDEPAFAADPEVHKNSIHMVNYYWFENYHVNYVEQFLVVSYYSNFYSNGSHGNWSYNYDTFDMRTGQLLELADVIALDEGGRDYLEELADTHLTDYYFRTFELDEIQFSLTDEGINLIFDLGFNQPYRGAPDLLIHYDDLGDLLKIDKPSAPSL